MVPARFLMAAALTATAFSNVRAETPAEPLDKLRACGASMCASGRAIAMTVGGDRWTAGNDGMKLLRLELPKPIAILNLRPIDKRPLTQEALAHLAAVPKIRTIRFHAGSVDDDAIKHLVAALAASGNSHDRVELSHVDVTDACIEHLQQLTALKRLKLSHTGVSADGLARLERALPECEIHYTPRK